MRDNNNNNAANYKEMIEFYDKQWNRRYQILENPINDEADLRRLGYFVFDSKLKSFIIKYSFGVDLTELSTDVRNLCKEINFIWRDNELYFYKNGYLKQYVSSFYIKLIWLLSFAVLLKIEDEHFKKVVEIIDRHGVVDMLFEKIFSFRDPQRLPYKEESYHQKIQYIPNDFKLLRSAVVSTDKNEMEKSVRNYVTKVWFKNYQKSGYCFLPHEAGYIGYWSFETAVFVAILDLDDSSFRDCPYYPKDLVDYFRG